MPALSLAHANIAGIGIGNIISVRAPLLAKRTLRQTEQANQSQRGNYKIAGQTATVYRRGFHFICPFNITDLMGQLLLRFRACLLVGSVISANDTL
jgi:hypothetical protein